jgi:Tfp pilus assembly protein PilE
MRMFKFKLILIEMMVVFAIVGMLLAVSYDAISRYKERAQSPAGLAYKECIEARRDDCVYDWESTP